MAFWYVDFGERLFSESYGELGVRHWYDRAAGIVEADTRAKAKAVAMRDDVQFPDNLEFGDRCFIRRAISQEFTFDGDTVTEWVITEEQHNLANKFFGIVEGENK